MQKAEIKFKIVTPMILGGANQKEAELRAPSIRGQLRHWFRVLGGSSNDEKKIFGGISGSSSSDNSNEGRSSSLVVRVKTKPQTISNQKMEDIPTAGRFDYFLWPLRNESDARGVITQNQEVEIEISHRRVRDSQELNTNVIKAFLLLGALGTRSRRAYGSIYPTSVKFDDQEWDISKNIDKFQKEISTLMSGVNCKILKLRSADSAKDAIQTCANALKSFRCGKSGHNMDASQWGKSDHDIMHHNGGREIYRAAIALPHKTTYYDAKIDGYERLASPVIFKIISIEKLFIPIVIFLKDYFIDEAVKVHLSKRGQHKDLSLSHDLLNEMMDEYSEYWDEASCLF